MSPISGRHVTFHVIDHRRIGSTVAPTVLIDVDLDLTRRARSSDNGHRTTGPTEGFNGRAETARGGEDRERRRGHVRRTWHHLRRCEGEVRLGLGATERTRSRVVRTRGVLGRVEGTKPDTGLLYRIAYLGGESAPWALPDSSEFDLRFSFPHPLRHSRYETISITTAESFEKGEGKRGEKREGKGDYFWD